MSNPLSPARDHVERFNRTYGIGNTMESRSRRPVPIPEDDVSELWYKVKKYIEYKGWDGGSEFLRLLHEAEDVIREAEEFVAAFEPETSYDAYMAEVEAAIDRWEE